MKNCRSRAKRNRGMRMKTGKLSEGAHLETVRARDARAQIVHNWCSVGPAKDAPAKRSISVNAIFYGQGIPQKNWRLVPNWEAKNRFCTKMGQALGKRVRGWS